MALATYSDLKTSLATFLNRDDLTSAIPDFIALAEASIARDVRHWRMETRDTLSFSDRYTELPDGWLETVRLTMGNVSQGYRALAYMPRDEMEKYRALNADTASVPRFYTLTGAAIEVWPTPSDEYASAELVYLAKVPALSDDEPTNWLLTNAPDVYLYGSLIHTAPYLQEDARVAVWGGLYTSAVAALNASSDAAKWSGTALRLRPTR